jgi:3-oxoacyl-[acyl-carrier-protein] synthase-3
MKVGLETVVSYFPETVVKRSDLAYLDEVMPEGMEEMLRGADEFRRLNDENAVEILAENVARKALDSANLTVSDIDFIIAANIGGKRVFPMVGTYVHHKLGFPAETPVLNIQNFCASFVDGINTAWNFILGGRYKRILVVTVTAIATKGWGVDQTSPMAKSFGDGAGAAIVSAENLKCEFLSYHNHTLGELYDHMYMELMPVMHPELKEKAGVKVDMGNYLMADEYFFQNEDLLGPNLALETISRALEKAHLTTSDLDMVVIHHPMEFLHERWIKGGIEAGIGREKWKEAWNKIANCGNVDVPAKLAELSEQRQIPKGSIIALFPPGLGGHTPCMVIRWLG